MVSLVAVSECFILPLTENGCDQHLCLIVVSGYFAVSIFVVTEWVFCLVVVSGCFAVFVFIVTEWVFCLVVVSGCFAVSVFIVSEWVFFCFFVGCCVRIFVVPITESSCDGSVSYVLYFLSHKVVAMGVLTVILGCVGSIRFPVTVVKGDAVQWTGY